MRQVMLSTVVDRANLWVRHVPTWLVYVLGALPAPWFFYLGLTGGLGVEPVRALEREYGELALKLVIAALVISPLRRFAGLNLLRFRRAVGLLGFYYVCCHLLVWLLLDVQDPGRIWADIVKRPFITVGMAAFLLMIPLAITSNDLSVRQMGPNWRRLQKLVFPAAALGGVHFVMQAKGFQLEPLFYFAGIVLLVLLRLFPGGSTRRSRLRSAGK